MPCVLPVLSLKVFGLVRSAGHGRRGGGAGRARHLGGHPGLVLGPGPGRHRGALGRRGGGLGRAVPAARLRRLPRRGGGALLPEPLGPVRDPAAAAPRAPRRHRARAKGMAGPLRLRPVRHADGDPLLGALPGHGGRLRAGAGGADDPRHLHGGGDRHGPPLPAAGGGAGRRGAPAPQARRLDGHGARRHGLPARRLGGLAVLRARRAAPAGAGGGDPARPCSPWASSPGSGTAGRWLR